MTRRAALPIAVLSASILTSVALPAREARPAIARAPVQAAPICDAEEILGYLYVNEETTDRTAESADNVVSGFAVHSDGCVEVLRSSPWPTGSPSAPGLALIASPRLGIAASGDRVYALSRGADGVAVFSVEAEGNLAPLDGSPFPTGGRAPEGLAVSPDGRWLFVAHRGDRRVTTLRLPPGGVPSLAASFDLDAESNGLAVSRDGRFLVAALPHLARVAVLEIAADGSLRHAPGSPIRADLNSADGVVLAPSGADLYVTASDVDRLAVSRYRLRQDGALDRVAGSPAFGPGGAGNVMAMLPDGSILLTSQTGHHTLTAFRVDAAGGLTPTSASPFPTGFGQQLPTGMTIDPLGRFLFVVHADGSGIATLRHVGDGFFAPAAAPVPSGVDGLPLDGLAFVPRAGSDDDADGTPFPADNCGAVANPDQSDADGDGIGDVCDDCPHAADPGQRDADRDRLGDRCDPDRDGDGVPDPADACPDFPDAGQPDAGQPDADGDGVGDACDNCPAVPNPAQEDGDRDREGDACARPFVLIGRLYVQTDAPDNAVAGYDVDTLGRMRRIPGSPFATGGRGPLGVTLFSPKRLEWSPLMPTLLFASNEGSDDLSVLRIGADGRLALATGRLRATGGSRPAGLAIRPLSLQLVVGHLGSANLSLFQVQPNAGSIFGIPGGTIATPGRPSGMAFTPDGRWLEVALPDLGPARTLRIDPPYQFVPQTGIGDRNGRAATPLFNRAGDRLYLASSTAGPSIVSAWSYDDEGMPQRLLRSAQTAGGLNSNILIMHPDRRHLYVSQQSSGTIGVLRIEPSGELATLGGPFDPAPFAAQPVGLATDASGRFLFAGNAASNSVAAYRITPEFGLESLGEAEKSGAAAGRPLAGVVFVPAGDEDGDGRTALEDNCPAVANPGQADADGDGTGDACDPCPLDAGEDGDSDGDGRGDVCDDDRDGDGLADADDLCPADADADQTDTDGDARGDRCDRCRLDPLDDADADGSCADIDNCPVVYNPFQENSDADPHGNFCDNCPFLWNDDQADIDGAEGGDACQRGFQQTGFLFLDTGGAANALAGWETKSTGRLMPLPGTPYLTLGTGRPGDLRTTAPAIDFAERGRFLFVLNTLSRDIAVFHLDADGLPRSIPGSPFPTGFEKPIGLVADPSGRSVWVAAHETAGGRLRGFQVARSGRLTPGPGEPVALEALPDGLALSPDGLLLAVSLPDAGRIRLFAITDDELVDAVAAPGGPPVWDGVVPGMPRPGPLAFVLEASGRLLLDVGSASPDRALVAALDLSTGRPAGPPLDLTVVGGVAALAHAASAQANPGGAPSGARVFAALPDANAIAVIDGLHGDAARQAPGSPFALPAGEGEPVGLAFDAPWLHVLSRQSSALTTFVVDSGGGLDETPVPPTAFGAIGSSPGSGTVFFMLEDRDGDGVGPLSDNCPSVANPGQENRDGDGAGDACQPEIALGTIVAAPYLPPATPSSEATALAASLRVEEPQGEPLSGRVVIAARQSVAASLHDALAGGSLTPTDCARVLRPAAGVGGGIAYVHGSIGDAVLFDQDRFLACDDGRADYELAEGPCGTPLQPFTDSLILNLRTPPFEVCARPISDRTAEFDLRLEAIEPDRLDLSAEIEQAIVEAPWAGRRPDSVPLEPLGAGAGPFTLAITASDGDTPPVSARASFRRDGAAALVFGTAPRPPDLADRQVECAAGGGTPVDLDAGAATDDDGDALTFFWFEEQGAGDARLLAEGPTPRLLLPLGTHPLVLDVVDASGLLARRSFVVSIADTRAPDILRLEADPAVLWPPNHRLVPVRLRLDARDACQDAARSRLLGVVSSEPDDAPGNGDGHTTGDVVLGSSAEGEWDLALRAERLSSGPGRTYRVRFVVDDAAGNAREATIEITVPRNAPR